MGSEDFSAGSLSDFVLQAAMVAGCASASGQGRGSESASATSSLSVAALARSDNVADRSHAFAVLKRGYRSSLTRPVSKRPQAFSFSSLSDLLMNIVSSAGVFIALAGICLDRLLQQRSALQKPNFPFDIPPPRGGLRSLSVGADGIATESRALSEHLS
jgi:hypothetical protein